MKDEELLKLASYFLTLHPIDENKPENLLKFARALYEEGYDDGYSKVLGIAGTVDCIAEYDGELAVIDFKTSKKPQQIWMACLGKSVKKLILRHQND